MQPLFVIGIGAGDPNHLTLAAVEAIRAADAVFLIDKGTAADELGTIREAILERVRPGRPPRLIRIDNPGRSTAQGYDAGVARWHAERAERYGAAIATLESGETGAFLVWGDPALYDSTLRILDQVDWPLDLTVIPGISAPQVLASAFGMALNAIGEPIHITTGRRISAGLPAPVHSTVVMLDDGSALASLAPDGLAIWWGAYLGTPDQVLIAGPLADVRERILATRQAARARKGWIMDTYLLRRL